MKNKAVNAPIISEEIAKIIITPVHEYLELVAKFSSCGRFDLT